MATSEARIKANQANSLKSCGPKTLSGKLASSRNSLKHGLAGAGVVLPAQDAAELEVRDAELQDEMNPTTLMSSILIGQMALYSIRMQRAAKHEIAAINQNTRHAIEAFDEARLDEADRLIETLGDDPRKNLRKLRSMPEGVEALIARWEDLKAALTRPGRTIWAATHQQLAENLAGNRIDLTGGSRITDLSHALHGDFSNLTDEDGGQFKIEDRKTWARQQLVVLIDAEIVELAAHHGTLDLSAIEADRQAAPALALFDTSKEATLARRYEAEATRGFFKAMKEMKRIEQEAAERAESSAIAEAEAVAEAEEARDSLASFRKRDLPPLFNPPRKAEPAFVEPLMAAETVDLGGEALGRPDPGSV